jgi:hypothetical protein
VECSAQPGPPLDAVNWAECQRSVPLSEAEANHWPCFLGIDGAIYAFCPECGTREFGTPAEPMPRPVQSGARGSPGRMPILLNTEGWIVPMQPKYSPTGARSPEPHRPRAAVCALNSSHSERWRR